MTIDELLNAVRPTCRLAISDVLSKEVAEAARGEQTLVMRQFLKDREHAMHQRIGEIVAEKMAITEAPCRDFRGDAVAKGGACWVFTDAELRALLAQASFV